MPASSLKRCRSDFESLRSYKGWKRKISLSECITIYTDAHVIRKKKNYNVQCGNKKLSLGTPELYICSLVSEFTHSYKG